MVEGPRASGPFADRWRRRRHPYHNKNELFVKDDEKGAGDVFAAADNENRADGAPRRRSPPEACRRGGGRLVALFFSDAVSDIRRAKEICAGCTRRVACLEGAVARREPAGVWGGQLFAGGRIVAVKRGRGRPPKDPARQRTA